MSYLAHIRTQAFIEGEWLDALNGDTLAVIDPANGETITHVPNMGGAETRLAISAAHRALPFWSGKTAQERSQILRNMAELMLHHEDNLASLLTVEQGKPISEARNEITYAASFLEWFAEEAKRAEGQVIPSPNVEQQLIAIRQPVGVVAAITPWNFPSAMITRKIGPALAAGCTVVLKPAAQTPLSALAIASLAEEAGLPNGVLNIVTGNAREIGAELTSNEVVRKLSFTGSTEIGRTLYRQCANTIKKLSLELGGNAPFIIFPDADIDAAVAGAIASKFRNAGQTCVCVNRFYVHDDIYDLFSKKLAERVSTLRVGHGLAYDTDIGPLIDAAAVHKVEEHIQNAISLGATLLVGGTRVNMDHTYFQPTVLTDVTHDMLITKEETFGPVAAIIRFTDEKEVIEQANNSELGLASYFYSNNHSQIWRVAQAIEAGMVGINTGQISSAAAPFGGIKQSGLGREGSRFGLDDYTEIKYLCLNTGSWKP